MSEKAKEQMLRCQLSSLTISFHSLVDGRKKHQVAEGQDHVGHK